jgi:hypothetical protein
MQKREYIISIAMLLLIGSLTIPVYSQSTSWQFIIYGDTRTNDAAHRSVLQAIATYTPNYHFIINVGDVVENGANTGHWNTWQTACDELLGGTGQSEIPPEYMACPGNHESLENSSALSNWQTYLSGQYQQYGNDGKFFVFDYENARFVILNSNVNVNPLDGEQYTMLLDAIQNNPQEWLFAIWHHPIFDFGPKTYMDDIHDLWGVPLYQNGCDILFMGHAHYYVRTTKLGLNGEMNPPSDALNGTVQIVTGNGGAPLHSVNPNEDGNEYMVEAYASDYGYTELTVDGNTMHLRHILSNSTVFDEADYTPNDKPVYVLVQIKIYIEGSYQTNGPMRTDLQSSGHIPLESPYNDHRVTSSVPENTVDWISIGLRETPDGETMVSKSFLLRYDGMVVDLDGTTTDLRFEGVSSGDYYIVVKHRNHLPVMSAEAVYLGQ